MNTMKIKTYFFKSTGKVEMCDEGEMWKEEMSRKQRSPTEPRDRITDGRTRSVGKSEVENVPTRTDEELRSFLKHFKKQSMLDYKACIERKQFVTHYL